MSDKWTIFGRANCKYCDKAKEYLTEKGATFDYYGIDTYPVLKTVITGMGLSTVPAIFYGPYYVGGYVDLVDEFHWLTEEGVE